MHPPEVRYNFQLYRTLSVAAAKAELGDFRLLKEWNKEFVAELLAKTDILMMPHSPYSPDMAPCDFFAWTIGRNVGISA